MIEENLTRIPVLDHGYVALVESWGSDESIVRAARMSTQKGFEGWGGPCRLCDGEKKVRLAPYDGPLVDCPDCKGSGAIVGDEKLLAYLWKNKHSTPFEMAGLTIEVQAPIFIFREWHRHRVPFGYSEASSRYAPLPNFAFVPTVERHMRSGGHLTRQAASTENAAQLTPEVAAELIDEEIALNEVIEAFYQKKLRLGVSKELARTHLSVSRYSKMRATGNLRGWLAFLALRDEKTAQYEIQMYAKTVAALVEEHFPQVHALYKVNSS